MSGKHRPGADNITSLRQGIEMIEARVEIDDGGPQAHESTLGRELQFLLSHTIHHFALIVALLELQRVELGAGFSSFGVAPSTLRYWEETGSLAG